MGGEECCGEAQMSGWFYVSGKASGHEVAAFELFAECEIPGQSGARFFHGVPFKWVVLKSTLIMCSQG